MLVTGSTGAIGQPLVRYFQERGHAVRGFARRPTEGTDDFIAADLTDRAAVRRAVEGMDAVVHLGAYPNNADFMSVLLEPNVIGLYNMLEACAEYKPRRVVLASTVQVTTGHRFRDRPVRVEDGPAPVNHYALTKAWAEIAGAMYARVHELSVISVRIGWFPRNTEECRRLAASEQGPNMFLSHRDANRFFELCLTSESPPPGKHEIVQAQSRPVGIARLDLEPARRVVGYEPQDTWPEGLPFPTA